MGKRFLIILCVFLLGGSRAWACTNLIVGKSASADGSVIVSYSADAYGSFGELCHYPAATHTKGSARDIHDWETGRYLGKIDEASQTYNVIGNINEFQVTIGETTFGGREELCDTTGILDYGSLIYVALQRSRTAKEAIKVMTDLVKKYGYCSEGESFTIADPNEAWILEMIGKGPGVRGAVWVAVRVPDDCISAHANQSRIRQFPLNDKQNCLYSPDVISFAREKGYFDGNNADFSFADAYCPLDFDGVRICDARVWAFFNFANPAMAAQWLPYVQGRSHQPMPLCIRPDRKLSVRDVQHIMRDHYEGTPLEFNGPESLDPFRSPYRLRPLSFRVDSVDYFYERPISTQQASFTFVAQMRSWLPNAVGGVLWFTADDANMSAYTPVYCCTDSIPNCYSSDHADCVTFSWDSAFWIYNWVAGIVRPRYSMMVDDMRRVQQQLEDFYAQSQDGVEKTAVELLEKSSRKGCEYLTQYTAWTAQAAIDTWKRLGEYLIVKYNDDVKKKTNADGTLQRPATGNTAKVENVGYTQEYLKHYVQATADRFKKVKWE